MAEASIHKLSILRHKYDVEVSGIVKFLRVFLLVILQPIALLVTRDAKGTRNAVDVHVQGEGKEGLRHFVIIFVGSEVVLELRVVIPAVVRRNANGSPFEIVNVVFQFYKEQSVVCNFQANFFL